MDACGEPCKLLTPFQRKLHLLELEQDTKSWPERMRQPQMYDQVEPGATDKESSVKSAMVSRALRHKNTMAALAHHREATARRFEIRRDDVLRRLLRIANTAEVRTADLVTIRAVDRVSREHLEALLGLDDAERAIELRRLLRVEARPWTGEGAIDPEWTRGVSVKQNDNGTLEIRPASLEAANRALATVGKMCGFDPKSDATSDREQMAAELGVFVRTVLGDEAAAKLLAALGE